MWSLCFFFFSSRRRHTRLQGDWSSDVCSSDLSHRRAIRSLTEEDDDESLSAYRLVHSRLTPGGGGRRARGGRGHARHPGRARPAEEDRRRLGGGPRDRQGRRGAECQGAAGRNGQLEVEARPAQRSARAGVPVEPGGPISTLQDGGQRGPDHRGVRERRAGRKGRSEEHTSELQSPCNLVCRLLLEKKKKKRQNA